MGSRQAVRASLKKGASRNVKTIPKEDSITVRLLDEPEDWVGFYQHYVNGEYRPCVTDECDGCDSDDPEEQKKSFRYLTNAYVVDDQKVWALLMPKTLVEDLMEYDKVYQKKGQSLLDRDFEFSRSGSGQFDTRYKATPDDRKKINLDRFEKKKFDLDAILDGMANGEVDVADEEEEEEETPRSKSKSRKPKSRPKDDPWADEDDEDDDEPEVRRRPVKKSASSKKRPVKKSSVSAKRRVRR
jgi:hypothetical protein